MTRAADATYSHAAMRAFDLFFQPWRRRHLRTAPTLGLPITDGGRHPLVLVANHTSWWDGFLLRDVHRALRPAAPFYVVMEAHELARLPFFRRLGAVGIDAQRPASVLCAFRALRDAARADPSAVIVYFPQGRIRPSWHRPLHFERGVELLLRTIGPCDVAPVGLHIEPLNLSRPTAFVSVGPLLRIDPATGASRLRGPAVPSAPRVVTAAMLESAVESEIDRIAALISEHGDATVDAMRSATQHSIRPFSRPMVSA